MAFAKNYRVPPATAKAMQLPTFDNREPLRSRELSPTCRGGGFVRRLVFKFPPKIRQPLFLQACPLRHYRIGLLSPQRYFFIKLWNSFAT